VTAEASSEAGPKRRPMRRRSKVAGGRPFSLLMRLSIEEKAYIDALADARGVEPQLLLWEAVTSGGTEAAAELQRMRDDLVLAGRLLTANSRNLNQITRAIHAGADVPALAATLESTRRATERVNALLAEITS
jgi:hypothetical protein